MYKTFRKSIALLLTMLMIFNVSAIAAGTTDGVGVKLYWSDDISSSVWNDAENADTNAIFAVDGFEAGSEAVRYLKVQSTGSLAYSYVLDAVYGGADASLAEAIDVYVKEGVTANVAISDMTRMGTLADVFSGAKLSEGKISPSSEAATDGYYYKENIIAVALKMPETVGAEYMNKILDGFDITLSATECDFEYARGEFSVKFPNTDKYLYRVGNQNTVAVGSLFEGANVVGDVKVAVTPLDAEHPVSGTYTANSSDWTKGTIQFGGTGIVAVTITDSSASTQPVSLKLEVVDAKNATTATSATANNVVLLNDISGGFSISNGYAVYGNGFTITCGGNGAYRERTGMAIGFINIDEGGILDSARVICDVFPISALYTTDLGDYDTSGDVKRYRYQLSAISISGDSTISNCYIYGARNNVFVGGGNVTIKDTILESGSLSNVHIKSNSDYNVTLDNLTTVQYPTKSKYDESKTVMGFGVLVGDNESSSNAAITLKGDLKQYNWVYSGMGLSNTYANYAIDGALDKSEYHYTINDKTSVNMGIAYLNALPQTIVDERSNKEQIPYLLKSVSILTETGHVYSAKSGSELAASRFDPEADGIIPCEIRENGLYSPQFKLKADLGGQKIDNIEGCDEYCYKENNGVKVMFVSGDYMELDLNAMVDIQKYTNQNLNLSITCKDSAGNAIGLSGGKLMLSQIMDYTVTYTVTDNVFYDKDGQKIDNSVNWTWDVPVSVTLKDKSIPDARFEFDSANQKIYRSGNSNIVQFIPFLAGLKIYDYVGQEEYLRFDGDNDFAKIAKASINNVNTSGEAQGYHIVTVELVDGGKLVIDMDVRANSGSSKHTGSIKVRDNVLYVVNDGTTSGKGQTWKIYSYKFIGNNGVEINSGAITFGTAGVDCDTATKPSSNFSTTVSATVTYDANGGTCGQTVGYKTSNYPTLTLPTPVRSGYIFSGWYTEANGGTKVGGAGDSYSPSANIALYARWGTPSKITYDANGGSCDKESEMFNGDALILPTPVLDGYWFKGWYTEPNGGTKVGDAGTTYVPTATATLYAQWSKIYTVNFDANGGSVSMSSTSYTGTSITLPLPSYSGQAFDGWYTAATGGEKIGLAGEAYIPSSDITLYAHWKVAPIVTYNANGGTCSTSSATYVGTALTLPTPSRTGYKCLGWYTAASGGTKIGDAGASYIPDENITLYAQWQGYTVTYNANGGSCSTPSQTYAGTALTLPTPTNSDKKFKGWYTAESGGTKVGDAGATYTPESDITLYAQWESCLVEGTLITLADGSTKKIEDLTYEDELLVWDFFEGKYSKANPTLLIDDGKNNYDVLTLTFDDGAELGIISAHGLYDESLNEYVYIDEENVSEYIGHKFVKPYIDENGERKNTSAELTGFEVTSKETGCYTLLTAFHNNCIANGMLSVTPPPIDGWYDYFEIGEDMKYVDVDKDIQKYGLYTYDDFEAYIPYEAFEVFNGKYLKILVEKGYFTFEDILRTIDVFSVGYSSDDNGIAPMSEDAGEITITSSGNTIASATYGITVTLNGNATENNTFVCDSDECVFTIAATGSASYRYAEIKIADNTYYTQALAPDGTTTFTAKNANGQPISFVPVYGTHQNDVTDGITFYSVEIQVQNATPSGDAYVCDTDEAVFGFTATGIGGTGYGKVTVDGKDFYTSQIAPGETIAIKLKNASGKTVTVATANGTHENEATTEINYYSVEAVTENMTATENGYVCENNEATITFTANGIGGTGYGKVTVDGKDFYTSHIAPGETATIVVKNASGKTVTVATANGTHENDATTEINYYSVEAVTENMTATENGYVCDTDEATITFTANGIGGTGYGKVTVDGKDFYTSHIAPGETATIVVKNASGKTVTVATANGTHENDATTEINYYSVEATTENMTATENGYVCDTDEATITFAASGIADGYVAITVDGDVYYAIVKANSEAEVTVKNAKGKELTYEVFAGECENESTTLIDLGTVGYTVDGTSVTISNTTKYEAEGYDVYVAVYSGNKLLGVQFDSVEKLAAKDSKTFAPEIDTPDNSTVKVFIWKYKTLIPYFN